MAKGVAEVIVGKIETHTELVFKSFGLLGLNVELVEVLFVNEEHVPVYLKPHS